MPHRFRCSVTGDVLRRTTLSRATTPLRLSRLQAYSRARRAVRGDGPAAAADPAAARPAARAGGARGAGSRPPEHSAGRAHARGQCPLLATFLRPGPGSLLCASPSAFTGVMSAQ